MRSTRIHLLLTNQWSDRTREPDSHANESESLSGRTTKIGRRTSHCLSLPITALCMPQQGWRCS